MGRAAARWSIPATSGFSPSRAGARPLRPWSGSLRATFRISTRMTLDATLPDGTVVPGLNDDLVVEKAVSSQVVSISVSVAGEDLVEYRTDAVIVATPTGSTRYTFSAGGPLIDPEIECLVVTAVAPHNLFGRPIVFGPTVALRIGITSDRPARAGVDGRHHARPEAG